MKESINYRGYAIDIWQYKAPVHPLENWDWLFPAITSNSYGTTDYSKGDILNYLVGYLSDDQLKSNILFIGCDESDDLRDELYNLLDNDIEAMAKYCEKFDIKHLYMTSTGYSQGDWIDVFICWTPEFEQTTGLEYKDVTESDMKGTFNLFGYWAWGDVYGYTVLDDSCGGSAWLITQGSIIQGNQWQQH